MREDATRFEVRLARTEEEVAAAQRLRYAVFVEEMGAPAAEADHVLRLEKDRFDPLFDHLILIDRQLEVTDPLDRVVAAYRLLPGDRAARAGGFYSAGEYDLGPIKAWSGRTVELGRSCVAPAYRLGMAMHLMWVGLANYVSERGIDVLFGVASFHGTDPGSVAQGLSYLHHRHLAPPDLRVRARADAYVSMALVPAELLDQRAALRQIPGLIKAYLRVGSFVGDGAYIDRDFNTIDVCMLMDTSRMVAKYRDFYSQDHAAA